MKGAVYRHLSASGKLLYVGYSVKPLDRNQAHRSSAEWFSEVATITIEWFETQEEALAAEVEAIKQECPRENLKDMPNDLFRKRKPKPTWVPPFVSSKPHAQLDALERAYKIRAGGWNYCTAGMPREHTNAIRESGRELLASEVIALKTTLKTTYKLLEQIGINRGNKG